MSQTEPPFSDDALDLPPLDDEDEAPSSLEDTLEDDEEASLDDPFDDAEGGGDPGESLEAFAEGAAVVGAKDLEGAPSTTAHEELPEFDDEESCLGEEEVDRRQYDGDIDEDLERVSADDAGEEGPLGKDDDLREEDLPALEDDDDAEVSDEALFERGVLGPETELLWADRAWVRTPAPPVPSPPPSTDDLDGTSAPLPGDEPGNEARDAAWRVLEAGARVTAAALVPGGSVVLALAAPAAGKARLVRITDDGTALVIAEIEAAASADDDAEVRRMRWDDVAGALVVLGNFETHAYRPA